MRTSAVLVALVAVQQAAAQASSWNNAMTLPSCSQADNQCTNSQKQGLDLTSANLPEGSCSSFGGFDLSGLSYGTLGGQKSKRDLFTRNGGSSPKCLTGSVGKSSGVAISCGSSIPSQKASISNMQVTVDKDTDVQFTHSYANSDKTCSYVKSCSASSVNSIDNTQCGGSTSVKCSLPPSSPHESCNIGIQSLGFDCTPGQQSSSPVSPSTQKSVSPPQSMSPPESHYPPKGTAPGKPTMSSSPPLKSIVPPFPKPSVASSSTPVGTAPASSAPASSSAVPSTTPLSEVATTLAPSTTPASEVATTLAPSTTPASEVATTIPVPVSTVEQVTSEVVYTTVTSCPVSKTVTQGGSTAISVVTEVSTIKVTSTMTVCTRCIAPPKKTYSAVPSVVPTTSSPAESEVATTAPAPSSAAPAPSSTPAESEIATTVPAPSSSPPSPPPAPQTTQEIVTTEIVYTTLTTCPVTNTVTPPHGKPTQQVTTTISTIISTVTSTICTKCIAPPQTVAPPPPPPASATPASPSEVATTIPPPASSPVPVTPHVPTVLPSCLKTWVPVTKCKDNSDYSCFCQDDTFTQYVYECISAWEAEVAQQQAAMSLYAGLCAKQVPAHPAIITAVPSTITLVPTPAGTTPASESPAVTPAPAVSVTPAAAQAGITTPAQAAAVLPPTTISISTTVTIPCPAAVGEATDGQVQAYTSMPSGCTTTSLLNTVVTVPQVALSTGPSSSVGLVTGPAPAAAATTAAVVPGVAGASSSAPVVPSPTASITPFHGAASKSSVSIVFVVALAGLFVLL